MTKTKIHFNINMLLLQYLFKHPVIRVWTTVKEGGSAASR